MTLSTLQTHTLFPSLISLCSGRAPPSPDVCSYHILICVICPAVVEVWENTVHHIVGAACELSSLWWKKNKWTLSRDAVKLR